MCIYVDGGKGPASETELRGWFVAETMDKVHQTLRSLPLSRRSGDRPLMSIQDWCRILGVPFKAKSKSELETQLLEKMQLMKTTQRIRAGATVEFGDRDALLAWLAAESLDLLQETLQTLPLERRDAQKPFMSLQDWCQAVPVSFKQKKKGGH